MDKYTTSVSITMAEYLDLIAAKEKLVALEAHGVDNWEGYAEAMATLDDEEEE